MAGRVLAASSACCLIMGIPAVSPPSAAAAGVYTTPGRHFVNGREWNTVCERYSVTVERCRTEILGSRLSQVGGVWRSVRGWCSTWPRTPTCPLT